MEKIRIIYDKVSKFDPRVLVVLDGRSVLHYVNSVIAEITGAESPPQAPQKTKFVSREEEYLSGAIEVNNLNLYNGEIIVPQKDYIYGYQDLTFDEFCSYIHVYYRHYMKKK